MFELGLGIVLAAWFVVAYFIYRKVFNREDSASWQQPSIETPGTQQLEEKPTKLFLTTSEMSAHHENEGRK